MRSTRTSRLLVSMLTGGALLGTGGLAAGAASAAPLAVDAAVTSGDTFTNPVTFADVPDVDVAYDGTYYYMVSTTMYLEPSVPIMRSTDMVHWSIVGYTAPILADTDALALRNGQNAYSKGTWAASIKYHEGTFYISVGSQTTGKTYIYSTKSIENGPWTKSVLDGYAHDQSLLFDGGDVYLVYGGGAIDLRKLKQNADGTFAWDGAATRLVDSANVDMTSGLNAEGSHAYKIGDYYYVFMIEWPSGGIRQEVAWRSKSLVPQSQGGTWEGKVVFSQKATVEGQAGDGAAQGGVIQAADGEWYAMLFQDEGPVGRSPQLAHVTWGADGWPQYTLTQTMPVPGGTASSDPANTISGIVASDEFANSSVKPGYWSSTNSDALVASPENAPNGSNLKLQWQWNHNPDNRYWSLTDRVGYLRLTTGSLATSILDARNTLTQRTYGPTSSGAISLDVSHMKDGDVAGISAYQQKYGYVAVQMVNGTKSLVMRRANSDGTVAYTSAAVPLTASTVYLRADTNYKGFANKASFFYSLDGTSWTKLGDDVSMEYNLAQFVGYRFAIFTYATQTTGGSVDVDWFHVSDAIGGGTTAPTACTTNASVIDNGGVESGSLAPWTGNGSAKVALTADDKASGTSSILATGRTNTGDGPAQSVANELVAGATYDVSAKVKYTTGPATKQFNVTVMDSNYKAYIMASATVKKGEWTTVKGAYTVPTTGLNLGTAKVFVETVWTGTPDATNDLMDFWTDDVSVTGATTAAFDGGVLDNGGYETGELSPWTANGAAKLTVTQDDKASGACSVLVTGRARTGDGPMQSVAGEVKAGSGYDVSAKVKYTSGPATKPFNVTIQDKSQAYIMASATVKKGEWTTVTGSYTVPTSDFDVSTAKVFVETVWTGTPDATNDLMDFWADDVSMKATTPTAGSTST
jgi:beta-xylosidase